MNKNEIISNLDQGFKLRIKTWPENFYLYKVDDKYLFSDNKELKDMSFFDVSAWEIYDESLLYFSARCESERKNKLSQILTDDDIIDL